MPRFNYLSATTVMENLLKRKWSAVILRYFETGIVLPADICTREPGLSIPVMNERLRTMQRYNLIARSPARIQARAQSYRLTPRGQRILQLLTLVEQIDQLEDIVIQTNPDGHLVIYARFASEQPPQGASQPDASAGGA